MRTAFLIVVGVAGLVATASPARAQYYGYGSGYYDGYRPYVPY